MKLPQLSLRELFLLVVIAAMGCGWWVDRRQIHRREQKLEEDEARVSRREDAVLKVLDDIAVMDKEYPKLKSFLDDLASMLEHAETMPIKGHW